MDTNTLLLRLSQLLGWGYFTAWSLSFYGQVSLNRRRKTVSGLSIDFTVLNNLGFACYALYSSNFYFNETVREEYRQRHNGLDSSVALNDVAFTVHAFVMSSVILAQTFYYERTADQRLSAFNRAMVTLFFFLGAVNLALVWLGFEQPIDFLYHLSYFKLYISFAKYIPQAYLNWRRKSTNGWSITNILLDFTGGCLSFLQAYVDTTLSGDWSAITGNPIKIGLSLLTLGFDTVFIIQHYVLFPIHEEEDLPVKHHTANHSKDTTESTSLLSSYA